MLNYDIKYTKQDILETRKSTDLIDIAYNINYGYISINNFLDKLIKIDDQFISIFDRSVIDSLDEYLEFIINEINYSDIDNGYPNRSCYNNIIFYLETFDREFVKLSSVYEKLVNSIYTNKKILYELLNFIIIEIYNNEHVDLTTFITNNHNHIDSEFFNSINKNIDEETVKLNTIVYASIDRQTNATIGLFRNIDVNSPFYTYPKSRSRLTRALFIWASLG